MILVKFDLCTCTTYIIYHYRRTRLSTYLRTCCWTSKYSDGKLPRNPENQQTHSYSYSYFKLQWSKLVPGANSTTNQCIFNHIQLWNTVLLLKLFDVSQKDGAGDKLTIATALTECSRKRKSIFWEYREPENDWGDQVLLYKFWLIFPLSFSLSHSLILCLRNQVNCRFACAHFHSTPFIVLRSLLYGLILSLYPRDPCVLSTKHLLRTVYYYMYTLLLCTHVSRTMSRVWIFKG